MGKILRRAGAGLLLLFLLLCTALPVFGASCRLFDEADFFSAADAAAIRTAAEEASSRTGISIAVGTVERFAGNADRQAESFRTRNGIPVPAVLLLYSVTENSFEFFPYGNAAEQITYKESDAIIENLRTVKARGTTAQVAIAFCGGAAEAYLSPEPAELPAPPLTGWALVHRIVISAVVGFAVAVIAVMGIVLSYRVRLKKPAYPLDKYTKLQLTDSGSVFLHKTVRRRVISSEYKSGGSRGKGGGSGGGRGRF